VINVIGIPKPKKLTLWGQKLDENFFKQFKEDLKKIYKEDFEVTTFGYKDNFITEVSARTRKTSAKFYITPFHSNCGAVVSSNINIESLGNSEKYEKGIQAIDKCITRCMEYLSKTALYYTVTENQKELTKALLKCNWKMMDKSWRNNNSSNEIFTLIKIR